MIPQLRTREGEDGGREEHGLIVRVRDEKADALAADGREALRDLRGEEPEAEEEERE